MLVVLSSTPQYTVKSTTLRSNSSNAYSTAFELSANSPVLYLMYDEYQE